MASKTKTVAPKTKALKASAKPTKVTKAAAPVPAAKADKPAAVDKVKKRKLDVEQEDAGIEKKRRKSVDEVKESGKGAKPALMKKSGEPTKPTKVAAPEPKPVKAAQKVTISEGASKPKVSKKAPLVEEQEEMEVEVDAQEEGRVDEDDDDDDDDDVLHGFSSGEDSSDDDDDVDAAPIDLGKIPTIAKDDETIKRRLDKANKQKSEERGVLYVGRIPHGFYEDQMRAYFSQFGQVTRLRLSRNKKSGRSKHYGFIEFSNLPTAEVVQDTMNNYLLFGRLLQLRVIPSDQIHPELWVGANRKYRPVPVERIARLRHNKERTEEEQQKSTERLLKRQEEKKRKLAKLGIDYDIDAAGFKA